MEAVMDLTDKTANFAFTYKGNVRYCGINGVDRINGPCLFSLTDQNQVVLDNEGLPANYMSALYASKDGNPDVNFKGQSLRFDDFFLCIIERAKQLAAAVIDSAILLVPFKSEQIHKWNVKNVLAKEGIYKVEFVPYCIAAALGYVGSYEQSLKEQGRSSTFMVFNADQPFCDCATFKTMLKKQKLGISFIKASHQDEFACMNMDSMIYAKMMQLLTYKLVPGRSRIVKYQFRQFENDIMKQLSLADFTNDGCIKLQDIEGQFRENELESVFDEDDVCYADGEFMFSDEYINSCQRDIQEKICSIIEHYLSFSKSSGQADVDVILGFGRLLDHYRGLAHDINILLQKYQFKDLTELKPADRFALLGARYFKNYELSREQTDAITLFNKQLYINESLIKQKTVVSFSYAYTNAFDVPVHIAEFRCGIKEGNSFKLIYFSRPYFYYNRLLAFYFELYSFAATYSIMVTWDSYYSIPLLCSYPASDPEPQHDFFPTKSDLATVIQVLIDGGCIFEDHISTDVEHSPHDLLYNIELISELLNKDEAEVKVLCYLNNLNFSKIASIKARLDGYNISSYREGSTWFEDLGYLLQKHYNQRLYYFENPDQLALRDVITCVDGKLSYYNSTLDLRFSCVIELGCYIMKLSDGFPLFFAGNSSTDMLFCCQLPVITNTQAFLYLLRLMDNDKKLDDLDGDNQFILYDRGNRGFLIYHPAFTLQNIKQTYQRILSAVNLLPCFGQSLLTFFDAKQLGKETLAEIIADGCDGYRLDAYDVKIMQQQATAKDLDEQFYPQPFVYNLTWKLIELLYSEHNLLLERATLRLALSYSSKKEYSGIIVDTSNALTLKHGSRHYAKMFLLSHYSIAGHKPICKLEEIKQANEQGNDIANNVAWYPMLSQELALYQRYSSFNAVAYCVTGDATVGTHELAVYPFVDELYLEDSLQRPVLKLQLEKKVFNITNNEIVLPYVPFGYLFYEIGFYKLELTIEKMNRVALTLSRKAPCCTQHCQRAVDHFIDKQNDPFYYSCPVPNCDLLFCLNCYTWHAYVKPVDRQCVSGFIVCPRCNYMGFYDKNSCYIINCADCGCFFCLFPQCGKSFKTYKSCEDHVFKHGKGIGKFERGDVTDLLINEEHI